MNEQYDNESGRKYKSRLLTEEERKELCVNSIKRVEPLLRALDEWRADSLNSKFRF